MVNRSESAAGILLVIPAKAGIQVAVAKTTTDSGLRRNDGSLRFFEVNRSDRCVTAAAAAFALRYAARLLAAGPAGKFPNPHMSKP
jgi:hypothetical protein